MPRRAKRIALLALAAAYAFTAWIFGPSSWTAILGGLCMAGGLYTSCTCRPGQDRAADRQRFDFCASRPHIPRIEIHFRRTSK